MARRVGWCVLSVQPPGSIPPGDQADWTGRVIASLESQCAIMGLDPRRVPNMLWNMQCFASAHSAWLRKSGRLAEARRTADQLMAIADQVVLSYPSQADSQRLLSEAHLQVAKNAWRGPDMAAVERSLRRSLDAVLKARSFAPDDWSVDRLVEDRRSRLVGLVSNR